MSSSQGEHGESMRLEVRLAHLERANRTWRYATFALLAAWVLLLSCLHSDSGSTGPRAAAADAVNAPGKRLEANNEVLESLRVRSLQVIGPNGDMVALLSGVGPELWVRHGRDSSVALSPYGITFLTNNNSATLAADGLALLDKTTRAGQQYQEVLRQLVNMDSSQRGSDFHKQLLERLDETVTAAKSVSIGNTGLGGMISIRNTFGKEVVSIQANKANEGAVYVHRVNGEMGNALVPR